MGYRHPIVLIALIGSLTAASAAAFGVDDVGSARNTPVAQLKPATIAFSDKPADAVDGNLNMVRFDNWALAHPDEKKFLALYPSYTEPTVRKVEHDGKPQLEKLYMYVAQARFLLDRAPGSIDLAHYVTLDFLGRIDPAIKHKTLAAADIVPFTDTAGMGNQDPDRKWCTGRASSICVQSTYKLEGKIPLGILLVNKLREGGKILSIETNKVFDTIPQEFDWCFYIQSDECVHEADLPKIKNAMELYEDDIAVDGLLFEYKHFYGQYNYIGIGRRWYKNEIRIIKNNKHIRSYKEAQGFRTDTDSKLRVKRTTAGR